MDDHEITYLIKELEICQDQMGMIPEEERSNQEIRICRKLIRVETDNIQFKYCLAKLLLSKGQDEKMRFRNHEDAYDLFEEVLELKPNYAQAHYHMGWLARYKKRWIEAITHFTAALASPALEHLDQIYAYCSRAYCLARIGNNDEAMRNLATAQEMANERMERNFVEEAEQTVSLVCSGHLTDFGQSRPFVSMDESGENLITSEEADSLASTEGFLILDLRARKPTCTGPKGQAKLEDGEAQLLEYLWVHPGYQGAVKIKEVIWTETSSESVVKKYINKLRHSLCECIQTDTDDLIRNMPRVGYRWQSDLSYRIIKPVTFTWTRYY